MHRISKTRRVDFAKVLARHESLQDNFRIISSSDYLECSSMDDEHRFVIKMYNLNSFHWERTTIDFGKLLEFPDYITWDQVLTLFDKWCDSIQRDIIAYSEWFKVAPKKEFAKIESISKRFIEVYQQAETAERNGLLDICGLGYRKAFEYLIKDYVCIGQNEDEIQYIRNEDTWITIQREFKDHPNLLKVCERSLWLGNDQGHVVILWVEKGLDDLKEMIHLAVEWISLNERTVSATADMGEGRKRVRRPSSSKG